MKTELARQANKQGGIDNEDNETKTNFAQRGGNDMGYIIFIILMILVIRSLRNSRAEKQVAAVRNGSKDAYISQLFDTFSRIRAYHEEFSGGISVCDYFIAVDGQYTGEIAKLLSVRVDDDDGHAVELARQLGMRIICRDGKYVYDLPVKGALSTAEKKAVLERLASMISHHYPNDSLKIDGTLLYDFVEMKYIIDALQRNPVRTPT